jgi:hypothetical protein
LVDGDHPSRSGPLTVALEVENGPIIDKPDHYESPSKKKEASSIW